MQINRLFEIVYILLDKKTITAGQLALHFEVSKRTILRDIDTLSSAGIPIYTSPGKGGGISILDNFVLNKTTISDEEQNQILFSLESLAAAQNIDADNVLAKLRALFDKTDTRWIEVDFSRWGNARQDKDKFELLKTAVVRKQTVSFAYLSTYGETTKRTVYPLKLLFKSRAWYLQGYCLLKKDYRIFKINRLFELCILPGSFAKSQLTPPKVDGSGTTSEVLVHLKLKFSSAAGYLAYDEFSADQVARNDDGTYSVETDWPNDHWLYGYLLSLGTAVQVIEPQCVKVTLLAQVEDLKKMYLTS